MPKAKIEKLTPEQEALIPVYREKWRKIAISTEPINREKAAEAIKEAYGLIGLSAPEIIFCDNPYIALSAVLPQMKEQQLGSTIQEELSIELKQEFANQLWNQVEIHLRTQLEKELDIELLNHLERQMRVQLWRQLWKQLWSPAGSPFVISLITPELYACYGSKFDFFISVLNCTHVKINWKMFQSLIENCGWIFPYKKIALVCDRPRILSFDNQQRLHAEGTPAIQFADGYSLYAYHGVPLPEKYGKIHLNNWQPSWLLEEENAELRRVLIQGIGYEKIASELGATELDSFQEYSLLKINTDFDIEPIYMLKMTCPSTGYIHILRVPPDVKSAREAIRWVNWGVDPEEFAVQT